ncbi:MAG TPA: hypothetical protein PLK12_00235 [Prolixibacteraceae bacterium]|nr:hypothetical protein [Prolixibacteraceae bacterium]
MKVNAHLHTPYSFSAFESIGQALDLALAEGVQVVGINDFNTTEGYNEWAFECRKRKLFPLFNIEFISLNKQDQDNGIRVNDPNNPGRTYLSGKGLSFPFQLDDPWLSKMNAVREESNRHVQKMSAKLNELLRETEAPFILSFEDVKTTFTKGNIRERHLAKALRIKAAEYNPTPAGQKKLYEKIFGGKPLKSAVDDPAALENEIRGNLLKAGGAAFVPEQPEAFLDMEDVRQIILHAGGIPTYPFLADFGQREFTGFENNLEMAVRILKERGFASVEFIPSRNSIEVLEEYARYCWQQGLIVTFGTEHNTPSLDPLEVLVQKNHPLSAEMQEINYKGTCVIAAHQHRVEQGKEGYLNRYGKPDWNRIDEWIRQGDSLIQSLIHS